MLPYKIDVPVLLVFFNRPEVFEKTFAQVRKAKPSTLLLYQDGPRPGRDDDITNIKRCREIVSNIDWDCKVFKKFQEENHGCDPSGYIAHKWAFENVDKCIIVEDDIVCSESFFRFCKEMLDRYEHDNRVYRICGMNHLGQYKECSDSYFFTNSGSIWGWATWKRVMDEWDSQYKFLDDPSLSKKVKTMCEASLMNYDEFISTCNTHKTSGREHFESIFLSCRLLHSGLSIVPKENLISNIGLTADSTHATNNIKKLPKGIQKVFFMDRHEVNFPLKNPQYVFNDLEYTKRVNRVMGKGKWAKFYRRVEGKIRNVIFR